MPRPTGSIDVSERLRVGIVGCGDVAHRHYLPALAVARATASRSRPSRIRDPGPPSAVAAAVADWSPGTQDYRGRRGDARRRRRSTRSSTSRRRRCTARSTAAILDAGVACYSEKPLASSVAEADALIDLAAERGVLFLVAPGSAVTNRMRWLGELAASGRYGAPDARRRPSRRPGPGRLARVHRRPDPVLPRGRRAGLRPRRLPAPRDDDAPRPGPTRPGDGLDRAPDAGRSAAAR